MATAPPFELKLLQRDWIEGVPGHVLGDRVESYIDQIRTAGEDASTRGVMLVETDPLRFAAVYFAAVYLHVPVILANPNWRHIEWQAVEQLVNPAMIFGPAPFTEGPRKGIRHPPVGTILIPTGGSSSGVKFAMHQWHTLAAACQGFQAWFGAKPVTAYCMLPLFHVSGLMQLMRSCLSGGQIVFPSVQALQAGHYPRLAGGWRCLSLVPTQLQRFITQGSIVTWLTTMQAILIGGAAMPEALAQQAQALQLPLTLSYGMTETAAMVTALPPDQFLAGQCNAGRPLPHVQIELIRKDGSMCAVGETGRIRIHSASMFKGYHTGSPSASPVGYVSGDEGYWDTAGCLHIVGRSDRLIISGGEKIDPHEVERAIIHTGLVRQVLVLGWPDSEWGQRIVALYIPDQRGRHKSDLKAALQADLANHKIPKQMIEVSQLPLYEHGKVDHERLQQLIQYS